MKEAKAKVAVGEGLEDSYYSYGALSGRALLEMKNRHWALDTGHCRAR